MVSSNEGGRSREIEAARKRLATAKARASADAAALEYARELEASARKMAELAKTNAAASTKEVEEAKEFLRGTEERWKVYNTSTATLSPLPRSLIALWEEYQFGLHGRKAAREFSTKERNTMANKQKYYRRNVIWECMVRQVRAGLTPEQAADELHAVYGIETSITKISELIVADRKRYNGYHPMLSSSGL